MGKRTPKTPRKRKGIRIPKFPPLISPTIRLETPDYDRMHAHFNKKFGLEWMRIKPWVEFGLPEPKDERGWRALAISLAMERHPELKPYRKSGPPPNDRSKWLAEYQRDLNKQRAAGKKPLNKMDAAREVQRILGLTQEAKTVKNACEAMLETARG